ncbi:MAG: nucleoside 2-deoxyribosyltransferase [Candidatus Saccharibacteria bacterium]
MTDTKVVHFIAPKTKLAEEIAYFRDIVMAIHKRGYVLARDWLEPAYLVQTHATPNKEIDWSDICRANIEVIPKCDIVIAEISTKSFGVGYDVGLAVSQKKPTLLLRRDNISKEAFLGGLDHPYVQKREYNTTTIDQIVGDFLSQYDSQTKDIRFNLFIDSKLNGYLQRASVGKGKTKAEIVRELLLKEMEDEQRK